MNGANYHNKEYVDNNRTSHLKQQEVLHNEAHYAAGSLIFVSSFSGTQLLNEDGNPFHLMKA
jgi:hypothetical protein